MVLKRESLRLMGKKLSLTWFIHYLWKIITFPWVMISFCYIVLWTKCLPCLNSYVEVLTPVWWYWELGLQVAIKFRWGHEGGDLMNGISILNKKRKGPLSPFLPLSTMEGPDEKVAIWKPGSKALTRNQTGWHLALGLPSLQDWEINVYCLKYLISGVL